MKAWQAHALGEPVDVLRIDEVDEPSCGPSQVVIEVHAVGLSFPDLLLCRGDYQIKAKPPFGVGNEVAGVVVRAGKAVTSVEVGTRVAAIVSGGLRERVTAEIQAVLPLPGGVPAAKAVAVLGNYTTAFYALHERAELQEGETLLVLAGSGGVGSSAIQLGVAAGARVIATAGGPDKVLVCERLGASDVIDYRAENLVERVRDTTDGAGVDVVFDPVGGDLFDQSRRAVGWNGRYLVIGFASGRIPEAPLNHVLLKNYSIVGVHWGAAIARNPATMGATFAKVMDLYERGLVDPLLFGDPLPFTAGAEGLAKLGARRTWGKVVVDPRR